MIENIVFETDCPYLTPVPLRGKRNYPGNIKYIVEFILKDLGFYSGNITSSDKEFGPKMDAAVREFQSTNKLTVDGIIGNQTWSKILQF